MSISQYIMVRQQIPYILYDININRQIIKYLKHTIFDTQIQIEMGYNPSCNDQTCKEGCCNYFGDCPDYFFSSDYFTKCYHYYDNSQRPLSGGEIAGIVIGSLVGAGILIAIIVICYKRRKLSQNVQATANTSNLNQPSQIIIVPNNNTAGWPQQVNGQPVYGQPVYGQPMYGQQPYPNPNPYINDPNQQVYPPVYAPHSYGYGPGPFVK